LLDRFLPHDTRILNDQAFDRLHLSICSGHTWIEKLDALVNDIESLAPVMSYDVDDNRKRSRLLSAIDGIEPLDKARMYPSEAYGDVESRIRNVLEKVDDGGQVFNFTDRTYQGHNPNKTRGGVKRFKNGTAGAKKMKYKGRAICWICEKPDCHSSKHGAEERRDAKKA
jgi:hypothetical protein